MGAESCPSMHWAEGKGNTLPGPSRTHLWMLYNLAVQPVGGDVHRLRLLFVFCSPFHPGLFSIPVPPLVHSRVSGCTCHMMHGLEEQLGVK